MNRLIQVTDPDNNITTYVYTPGKEDIKANLTSITDAKGSTTTMTYDLLDRLIQTTNPGGFIKTYTYDDNNNMLTSTDAKAQTITYEYDSLNRLIKKTLPDNLISYRYDSMGNILTILDSDSWLEMEYDTENRLIMVNSFINSSNTYTFRSDFTIESTNTFFDGMDITVDGATLTLVGQHTFSNLTLINGAIVTHDGATTATTDSLNLTITGTLTIDSTSSIDVTDKGYLGGYRGNNNSQYGRTIGNTITGGSYRYSGGSYGGLGGQYSAYNVNSVYGSLYNPNELGSGGGGGYNFNYYGGNGGGLVRIIAGEVVLEGSIVANGGDGNNSYPDGGGSAGGVYVQTGILRGTGIITADGGNSSYASAATSGGGGGRIAVYYTDISGFNIANITAYGGTAQGANGGAGTIYLKSSVQSYGDLIVDNGGIATSGYSTPLPSVGTGASTSLTADTLTDNTRDWIDNELVGIYLNPNTTQSSVFEIISNDATMITTDLNGGDMTLSASTGNPYIGEHYLDNLFVINGAAVETLDDVYYTNSIDTTGGTIQANNFYQTGRNVIKDSFIKFVKFIKDSFTVNPEHPVNPLSV